MINKYSNFTQRRYSKHKGTRLIKFFVMVLAASLLMYSVGLFISSKKQKENLTLGTTIKTTSTPNPNIPTAKNTLSETIQSALKDTSGDYAVVIKNFKTQEEYLFNEHKKFQPGSLYKLWIMAKTYEQIQNGKLTKDQVLTQDIAVLNEKFYIDPSVAEQTEGAIKFSVDEALNQMITISHNYAALLLTEKLRLSQVALFLKQHGFNESTVGTKGEDPTTTAFDIAIFFEKLYRGELADSDSTQSMLNLLKKQTLNNKLPKYLPENIEIAHKTGEIGSFSHDGGIVYTKTGDYIIVIFSDSNLPSQAEERIAGISKAVFEYFQK